jgi:DNA-directed RNA polymerase subunit RPC12/RpoP
MPYTCPVCAYDRMVKPPVNFTICSSCGTEFGYDDAGRSYEELRAEWLNNGALWFSDATPAPDGWNGYLQLLLAGSPLHASPRNTAANTTVRVRVYSGLLATAAA